MVYISQIILVKNNPLSKVRPTSGPFSQWHENTHFSFLLSSVQASSVWSRRRTTLAYQQTPVLCTVYQTACGLSCSCAKPAWGNTKLYFLSAEYELKLNPNHPNVHRPFTKEYLGVVGLSVCFCWADMASLGRVKRTCHPRQCSSPDCRGTQLIRHGNDGSMLLKCIVFLKGTFPFLWLYLHPQETPTIVFWVDF